MSRLVLALAALTALTVGSQAQTAAPSTPAPTTPAPTTTAPADTAKPADGQTATEETYKMKDGGMYQPPAQRPASPAQDTSVYGRT